MTDVRIKDIRVLPWSLDLKSNGGKSLLEILGQLQSGTIIKGLVVGTTKSGEAIFHSSLGRFAIKNNFNLERGDTITLQLVDAEDGVSGSVISVNDKKYSGSEAIKLNTPLVEEENSSLQKGDKLSNAVNADNMNDIPKKIDGSISYLNLSKISKHSPIFQALGSINVQEDGIDISLITVSDSQGSKSPFVVFGEVSRNSKEGNQLITTNFGIIVSKGTSMPVGQKLSLEITNVNNQSMLNIMNKNVSEFMHSANQNWPLLKNLMQAVRPRQTINTKNKKNLHENTKIERSENTSTNKTGTSNINIPKQKDASSVNEVIKNFGGFEEVRKLSSGLLGLKELLLPSIRDVEDLGKWHNIILPFYNGEKIDNHEMQIHRPSKQFLRFIINVELRDNPMQIDGLIKFENNTQTPEKFDLVVRSKEVLDEAIQNSITQIYQMNQNISGMRGFLSIEEESL